MTNSNGIVYVVDDDESVREGVADLVSSAGLMARTVSSGREFLTMERPNVPSCLVLDVNLPELSGIELQQELARCGVQIPVIFLTGQGDIPMTVRALKAGAADFLTKPVHDEELLKAIRQCIAGDRTAARNLHEVQNSSAIQANDLQDWQLYMESEPGIAINCKALHKTSLGALAVSNMRMEERVQERTRIARDLHDTLLQSFPGLLMRFQTASRLLPGRPAEAKERLDSAIEQAEAAILEGREAVQGLRVSTVQRNDLAVAINTLGEELASDSTQPRAPKFSVEIQGEPQDLHPILRDEIYRIAAEALRNAFRHSRAQQIEVEIHYGDRQFRLRVRDDGRGFDPKVPASKRREGHYGLAGMKERAEIAGGKLSVWSAAGAGTEVELEIPASTLYTKASKRSWLSEKLAGRAH